MKELLVSPAESGRRLDKYLEKYLADASRSFIYKMLRKKNITLNDKKASGSEILNQGDKIKIFFSQETLDKFKGNKSDEIIDSLSGLSFELDVIYEDEDILLINKPAGLLSQKAKADDVSLCEYIISYLLDTGKVSKESLKTYMPGVCNRLDRNTSGLITAGKTIKGLQMLSEALRDRSADKYYLAVVNGVIKENTAFKGYLIKDEGTNTVRIFENPVQNAEMIYTEIFPLASNNGHTLVKLKLLTGKTHQLRATLAYMGYPIIGDKKYGNGNGLITRRPMLHSYELSLNDKSYIAPIPADFKNTLIKLGIEHGDIR